MAFGAHGTEVGHLNSVHPRLLVVATRCRLTRSGWR